MTIDNQTDKAETQPQTDYINELATIYADRPISTQLPDSVTRSLLEKRYGLTFTGMERLPVSKIEVPPGLEVTTKDGVQIDLNQWLPSEFSFYRAPLIDGETDGQDTYIVTERTQGRAASVPVGEALRVNGREGIFHDADSKGVGLGGDSSRGVDEAESAVYRVLNDPQMGSVKVRGILDSHEATATILVSQDSRLAGIYGEEVIGIIYPESFPSADGQQLPTVNSELTNYGVEPVLMARLYRHNRSLADLLAGVDYQRGNIDLHKLWPAVLDGNFFDNTPNISIANIEDDQVKNIIDQIRDTASPVIDRMRRHYQENFGVEASNEDLFNWFSLHHESNYQILVTNDLVHGALHSQNVKVEGEWGDKVTIIDNETLTDEQKAKKRVSDFIDVYLENQLMATALGIPLNEGLSEFYDRVIKTNMGRNRNNYPDIFRDFIFQDGGPVRRSSYNYSQVELAQKMQAYQAIDPVDSQNSDWFGHRLDKLTKLQINCCRLNQLASAMSTDESPPSDNEHWNYRVANRAWDAVFVFQGERMTYRNDGRVYMETVMPGNTGEIYHFTIRFTKTGEVESGIITNNQGEVVSWNEVEDSQALVDWDKRKNEVVS